jgi:hypothetical protein
MWTHTATWHGSRAEFGQLAAAVRRHCGCKSVRFRGVAEVCPAHAMLSDQRVLDHLLFAYRSKSQFQQSEWGVDLAS